MVCRNSRPTSFSMALLSSLLAASARHSEMRRASTTISLGSFWLGATTQVKFGLVESLNRPGGAATGIAWLTSELFTKRLEIMRELVPTATLIGVLINPKSPEVEPQVKEIEAAAQTLRQSLHTVNASTEADFDTAFAALTERRAGALISATMRTSTVCASTSSRSRRNTKFPRSTTAANTPQLAGLISYGTSYSAAYRELGVYAGKILKGTKPADLPIEQATKFEMVINLLRRRKPSASKFLAKLLALADEVIE